MKKIIFLTFCIAIGICSCSKKDLMEQTTLSSSATVLSAGFTIDNPDEVKEGNPAQFRSVSPGAVIYKWDFGNGDISAVKDPVYTFGGCGTHTVQLTVNDASGNQKSISVEVVVLCKGKHAY